MNPRLELRFLKSEPSKLWVVASNETFAGEAEQYFNEMKIEALRDKLSGFPVNVEDEAILEVGNSEETHAYCKLRFYCFDRIGHTAVQVSLASDTAGNEKPDNRSFASFRIQFEPNELNHFVASLRKAIEDGEGTSVLKGVKRFTENACQ